MSNKKVIPTKLIILFEDLPVRRIWLDKEEKWYFAVVDIIEILTESKNANTYWRVLKKRLIEEGLNETVTKSNGLKMRAKDGKMRITDTYDVEGVLRIIQSIPSKKAEPFKQWLAKVGYERLQEIIEPERAINRARENWKAMGAPEKWIEQRMRGQEIRNKLTDYWQGSGVKEGIEYAKLTNIIHKEWSELDVKDHKKLKGIDKGNLRDNMTEAELVFAALAELSTTQIAQSDQAQGYGENAMSAQKGGGIAKNARKQLEKETGKKVVSADNFLPPKKETKKIKYKKDK